MSDVSYIHQVFCSWHLHCCWVAPEPHPCGSWQQLQSEECVLPVSKETDCSQYLSVKQLCLPTSLATFGSAPLSSKNWTTIENPLLDGLSSTDEWSCKCNVVKLIAIGSYYSSWKYGTQFKFTIFVGNVTIWQSALQPSQDLNILYFDTKHTYLNELGYA